jgi:hypothetical protein
MLSKDCQVLFLFFLKIFFGRYRLLVSFDVIIITKFFKKINRIFLSKIGAKQKKNDKKISLTFLKFCARAESLKPA